MRRTGAQLKAAICFNERVAELGAVFVVIGLAFEVVFASVFHEPPETYWSHWGPVGADVVVTLGVAAEVLFGRRQRIASDELAVLSEKNVVAAMERASLAEKAAAEARERTAEVERLTAWRRLTPLQTETIKSALKPFACSLVVAIEHENGDTEAYSYARDIVLAVRDSGVKWITFGSNSFLGITIFGVVLSTSADFHDDEIVEAFKNAKILDGIRPCDLTKRSLINGEACNLLVWVGPKNPPSYEIERTHATTETATAAAIEQDTAP